MGRGGERIVRDLASLYRDVLFALDERKRISNGVPSLHARWLRLAQVQPGERVAHIGAGAGDDSAILAELVGPRGEVAAVEYDEPLARRAHAALADLPQTTVIHRDGALWPRRACATLFT